MSDTVTDAPTKSEAATTEFPNVDGTFFWYELMTSDQDGAIDFYTHVAGYQAADFPNPEIGDFRYTILSVGDRGVAGVMTINDDMKKNGAVPAWIGVIAVADADEAARRIKEAGGTVHKGPADIPTVGRFAVASDPGGAIYEVLAPFPQDKPMAPLAPDTAGKVGWHELYSSAGQEKAFAYYSGLYGWTTETEMDMGPMGKYRIFGKNGVQLGGMMDKPENVPVAAWTFYINVDGLDAAVERVKAKGGQVLMGPMEVPGGSWIIQGKDPQGAHFALVSLKR
jgi:predicted enzyme related to lactoylglutathione lyase